MKRERSKMTWMKRPVVRDSITCDEARFGCCGLHGQGVVASYLIKSTLTHAALVPPSRVNLSASRRRDLQ